MTNSKPLQATGSFLRELLDIAGEELEEFVDGLKTAPAVRPPLSLTDRTSLRSAPGKSAGDARILIERCISAACVGPEVAGPRYFAHIPNGGIVEAAVGELLSLVLNRYVPLRFAGSGLAVIEDGLLRWMAGLFGLPDGANGLITTGGSQAMLTMMIGAREQLIAAGGQLSEARLYVSDQAHHSIAKAAHIAGLPPQSVCVLSTHDGRHLHAETVICAIREDRAAGLRPFLLVATAGTTNVGSIDPLDSLADVAHEYKIWYHIDACYGGFFMLTERGRSRLKGISRADSISLDPHKSLFLPFGTGTLLVRDPDFLKYAHRGGSDEVYLHGVRDDEQPEYADLGSELSREARGLRLWLPLHLHGLDSFTRALDEKLDLAVYLEKELRQVPGVDVLGSPELSIVAVRVLSGNDQTLELINRINSSGDAFCSGTVLDGYNVLRICVLSIRTQREHIDRLIGAIRRTMTVIG